MFIKIYDLGNIYTIDSIVLSIILSIVMIERKILFTLFEGNHLHNFKVEKSSLETR